MSNVKMESDEGSAELKKKRMDYGALLGYRIVRDFAPSTINKNKENTSKPIEAEYYVGVVIEYQTPQNKRLTYPTKQKNRKYLDKGLYRIQYMDRRCDDISPYETYQAILLYNNLYAKAENDKSVQVKTIGATFELGKYPNLSVNVRSVMKEEECYYHMYGEYFRKNGISLPEFGQLKPRYKVQEKEVTKYGYIPRGFYLKKREVKKTENKEEKRSCRRKHSPCPSNKNRNGREEACEREVYSSRKRMRDSHDEFPHSTMRTRSTSTEQTSAAKTKALYNTPKNRSRHNEKSKKNFSDSEISSGSLSESSTKSTLEPVKETYSKSTSKFKLTTSEYAHSERDSSSSVQHSASKAPMKKQLFRTPSNGEFEVMHYYAGQNRFVGTYKSRIEAAKAKVIFQKALDQCTILSKVEDALQHAHAAVENELTLEKKPSSADKENETKNLSNSLSTLSSSYNFKTNVIAERSKSSVSKAKLHPKSQSPTIFSEANGVTLSLADDLATPLENDIEAPSANDVEASSTNGITTVPTENNNSPAIAIGISTPIVKPLAETFTNRISSPASSDIAATVANHITTPIASGVDNGNSINYVTETATSLSFMPSITRNPPTISFGSCPSPPLGIIVMQGELWALQCEYRNVTWDIGCFDSYAAAKEANSIFNRVLDNTDENVVNAIQRARTIAVAGATALSRLDRGNVSNRIDERSIVTADEANTRPTN